MTAPGGPDRDPDGVRELRDRLLAIMLACTFAAGALFGILGTSLGVPAYAWPPLLLGGSAGFWLVVARRRR